MPLKNEQEWRHNGCGHNKLFFKMCTKGHTIGLQSFIKFPYLVLESPPPQGFERQKSPGVIGLKVKVLLFRLHSIAIYFADIQFSNKEPVRTQVLTFSRFNSQTPTSSSSWGCNLDKDYSRYTKWGPDLIFQVLPCIATFKLG